MDSMAMDLTPGLPVSPLFALFAPLKVIDTQPLTGPSLSQLPPQRATQPHLRLL